MATANNIVTSYTGKEAEGYLTRALKAGDTLGQNLVTVRTGIKEKGVPLRRLDVDDLIQDSTCDFDPQSEVSLDERRLLVKKLQVNLQLCKEDFEGSWEAEDMGDSAFTSMPAPYLRELLIYIAGKIAEANDRLMWQGTATAKSYLGFLQKMAADTAIPAGQKITGSAITAATVATELGKVVDAIPDAVFNLDSDLVIVASSDIGRKYMRALAGFGASGLGGSGYQSMGFVGRKPLDFEGIPMFLVGGLPTSTMLAYKIENLYFGTGVLNNWTEIKVLDMSDILGDQNFRIIMRFYAGVEYGFSEEIVTYNLPEIIS
jgi:hypothetical protein